jgi:hypothetical protein
LQLRNGGSDAWKFTHISATTSGSTTYFEKHNLWLVKLDVQADGTPQSPQPKVLLSDQNAQQYWNPDPNTPGLETVELKSLSTSTASKDDALPYEL